MTVAKDQELRNQLREAGVSYGVVKNTLARKASEGTALEPAAEHFKGVTAVALSKGDPVALSKAISKFTKANPDIFTFKAGVVEGRVVALPEVEAIAKRFDAKVTLLHVFEIPVTWYAAGEAPLINAECFEQFAADAKQRLLEYPIQLPADRVERIIAEGDPAWHIRNWVQEHDVDLIMMGTLKALLVGGEIGLVDCTRILRDV